MRTNLKDILIVTSVTVVGITVMILLANLSAIKIDLIAYFIPAIAFAAYIIIIRDKKKSSFFTGPLFWSIAIAAVTAGVILYYVLV